MAQTTIKGMQIRDASIARGKIDVTFEANLAKIESDIQSIFNTMSTDAERMAAIQAVTNAWMTADGTLQGLITDMVNATKAGAGLELDGSFVLPIGQNYLTGATSLKTAIGLLDAALKTEENARTTDVSLLQTQITTLTQAGAADAQAAIAAEALARQTADTALQTALTAEEAARIAGDANLQTQVTDEVAARTLLNQTLSTAISDEAQARTAADNAEATARSNADTALQSNIDAEALARANADTVNSAAIAAETAARTAADTQEATDRAAADALLDSRIANVEGTLTSNLTYDKLVVRETPAGLVDGLNTLFTLLNMPYVGSESVFVNGQLLDPGADNDYTIVGKEITLAVAPTGTDKVRVSYFR